MSVPCLRCGELGSVYLSVDDGDTLHCFECGEEHSITDVETLIREWTILLDWIRKHPGRKPKQEGTSGGG